MTVRSLGVLGSLNSGVGLSDKSMVAVDLGLGSRGIVTGVFLNFLAGVTPSLSLLLSLLLDIGVVVEGGSIKSNNLDLGVVIASGQLVLILGVASKGDIVTRGENPGGGDKGSLFPKGFPCPGVKESLPHPENPEAPDLPDVPDLAD